MSKELIQVQFGPRAIEYVHSDVHAVSESLDAMLCRLQRDPIPLALDIATGGGHTALALSRPAKKVVASDISVPMLRAARDWITKNGAENEFFCQHDAGLILFPDLTFDVVTCRLTPHHFQI